MTGWKWDWQHGLIALGYFAGVSIGVANLAPTLKTETGAQVAVSFAVIAVAAIASFFKSTPKDLGEAFGDGKKIVTANADETAGK